MATGPRYNVPMRRRREGRTDYHQRLRLLKSGEPRLVARVSNRHVRAQLVSPGEAGDRTLASAESTELPDFGWEAPTGNLSAAYLTGYLLGRRAAAADVDEAVLDIGLHTASAGAKVFAVQEGAVDGGLYTPHSEDVFPDWERTRGEHVAEYAEAEGGLYGGDFDATELPAHFDAVLETIRDAEVDPDE